MSHQFAEFERVLENVREVPVRPHQASGASATDHPGAAPMRRGMLIFGGVVALLVMSWVLFNREHLAALLFASPSRVPPPAAAEVLAPSSAETSPVPPATAEAREPAAGPVVVPVATPAPDAAPEPTAPKRLRTRQHKVTSTPARPRPAASPAARSPSPPPRLRSGASCRRSAECESGLCVAEVCR